MAKTDSTQKKEYNEALGEKNRSSAMDEEREEALGYVKPLDLFVKALTYNYLNKKFYDVKEVEDGLGICPRLHEVINQRNANQKSGVAVESENVDAVKVDKIFAVVGAGLSRDAGLLLGNEAGERLIREFVYDDPELGEFKPLETTNSIPDRNDKSVNLKFDIPEHAKISKSLFRTTVDRIRLENGQSREDFETVLEALSQFPQTRKKVQESLSKMYSMRNFPVLGYEILAHMMRHRAIDGIINFNFDELLDESLEEEFHHEEYVRLVGGGDFIDLKTIFDVAGDKLPVYIKPHGTASDVDSIRATRDRYTDTTHGIQEMLENVLTGHVVFLVVGFRMVSVEFNQLIKRLFEKGKSQGKLDVTVDEKERKKSLESLTLFHIQPKSPEAPPVIKHLVTEYTIKPEMLGVKTQVEKKGEEASNWGSVTLQKLFDRLEENLKQGFRNKKAGVFPIHDIKRHLLIHDMFSNIEYDPSEHNHRYEFHLYYYTRILVELVLGAAKSGVIINLNALRKDRLGRLFRKFRDATGTDTFKYSLAEICEQLKLRPVTYAPEVYTGLGRDSKGEPISFSELVVNYQENWEGFLSALYKRVDELIWKVDGTSMKLMPSQKKLREEFRDKYKESNFLDQLRNSETRKFMYEIGHPFNSGVKAIFRKENYRKLYTWDHVLLQSENLMEKYLLPTMSCDSFEVFYVAETATWILDEGIKTRLQNLFDQKSVRFYGVFHHLPEAHYNVRKAARELGFSYEKFLERVSIGYVNWWRHNRNIFLISKNGKPQAAIYFYRGHNSRTVSPIVMELDFAEDSKQRREIEKHLEMFHSTSMAYYISSFKRKNLRHESLSPTYSSLDIDISVKEKIKSDFNDVIEREKRGKKDQN